MQVTLKKDLASNPKTLTFGRVYNATTTYRQVYFGWSKKTEKTYSIINDNGNKIMVNRDKFNEVKERK